MTVTSAEGEEDREALTYERQDFWCTRSNKQLNFLQHIVTLLRTDGRAAVVLPDNVLFEGGAGATIRRKWLETCDVHTILRLPTGLFYAQGVKANVVFFDSAPRDGRVHTLGIWFYDLRTNQHFTLKTRPMKLADLRDFVDCDRPQNRHERQAGERFRFYPYDELVARDKASLDLFWLKDDSLDRPEDRPAPEVLQQEIVERLEAALAPAFAHRDRKGKPVEGADMLGPTLAVAGAGVSNAGRLRPPWAARVEVTRHKTDRGVRHRSFVEPAGTTASSLFGAS